MSGILNRVGVVISTTGQGTVTVGTAISNRFLTPSGAGAIDGQSYFWMIEEGLDFEIFEGVWSSGGNTVTRAKVWKSNIGGTPGTTKMTLAGGATLRSVLPKEFTQDFMLAAALVL